MYKSPWMRWLVLLLPLLALLVACNNNTAASNAINVSGTIQVSDGTVPAVANLKVFDSNNIEVANTGITGIRSDNGGYSVRLPGPGIYKFVVTAINAAGRNISKTTPNLTIANTSTLVITLSPAAPAAAAEDQFDIGTGSQSLLPA